MTRRSSPPIRRERPNGALRASMDERARGSPQALGRSPPFADSMRPCRQPAEVDHAQADAGIECSRRRPLLMTTMASSPLVPAARSRCPPWALTFAEQNLAERASAPSIRPDAIAATCARHASACMPIWASIAYIPSFQSRSNGLPRGRLFHVPLPVERRATVCRRVHGFRSPTFASPGTRTSFHQACTTGPRTMIALRKLARGSPPTSSSRP